MILVICKKGDNILNPLKKDAKLSFELLHPNIFKCMCMCFTDKQYSN